MVMTDELFKNMVDIPSVSGNENKFQEFVDSELKSITSSNFEDVMGNYITTIGSGKEKVLITAHADEVGFIVTYINDQGYIYVQPVGGIDADIAVGQVVTIQTKNGPVTGIFGRAEIWDTASSKDKDDITPFKELWIDIGANKKTKELVSIGDPVIFITSIYNLPDAHVLSRAADDKLGVFTVIRTAKNFAEATNPNVTLYIATTTQEEVGSRGVQPVATHVQPKYSIVIDTVPATDVPSADSEELGRIVIGGGPTISRGSNTDHELFAMVTQVAEREQIHFQIEAEPGPTATDADSLQITGSGSATIIIGIPVRYTHFPAQVFSWDDVENCIKLISEVLKSL
jgi:endoglucanase